jgi:hypothetical protein
MISPKMQRPPMITTKRFDGISVQNLGKWQ